MDDIGKLIFMGFYTPLVQKSQIINVCITDPYTLFSENCWLWVIVSLIIIGYFTAAMVFYFTLV